MEFDISLLAYLFLFLTAVFASFIDAIAGGGGLITIPALLYFISNPVTAIATNKLQACFGSATASIHFLKSKEIKITAVIFPFFMSLFGSILGSVLLKLASEAISQLLIPFILVMLILVALTFLLFPSFGNIKRDEKVSQNLYALTFGFLIGTYDGFLGPGTGTFFAISLIVMRGYDLRSATMRAKILNFASNLGSMFYFLIFSSSNVIISVGLIMALGQLIGAKMGAKMVMNKGNKIIRPLVIVVSIIMSINLLMDYFHK